MKKQRENRKILPTADLFAQAVALHRAGNLDEAEKIYKKLLASHPKDAKAIALLGALQVQRGNSEEAIELLENAIILNPNEAGVYNNLGIALTNINKYSAAVISFDKAVAINPNYAEAYNNRGVALYNLKQDDEALESCDKAIALSPSYAETYNTRGVVLCHLKRGSDALISCDKAIAINPNFSQAYNTRGIALQHLKRYEEALKSYDKAIAINPNLAEAYNNRGITLYHLKQYSEALKSYDKAIAINPNNPDAYWSKGLLALLLGDYKEGWKLHEWRWKRSSIERDGDEVKIFQKPLWLGKESLTRKTIFIHAEKGLGDTIQFCRYAPMVEALGAKVILYVPTSLINLVSTLKGTLHVITHGSPIPDFDFHCPLMSLPLALGTLLDTIPADVPYLHVTPEKLKLWRDNLGLKVKPRIGLVWSGNPEHKHDNNRSIALKLLTPLLNFDFDFYALQTEIKPEDEMVLEKSRIISFKNNLKDFSDTAALISEMDIVISVDTSVAHLVGALGKNVWILLHAEPDFRWMLNREDSPWYPTARLFRQHDLGDWESVIAKVNAELAAFSSNSDLKKMPSAYKSIPKSVQQIPSADDLFSKAIALHKIGNLDDAQKLYQSLLVSYPERVDVANMLGTICFQQGNFVEGIRLLEKAIIIKPDYVEAYYNLGLALQRLNRDEDALVNYNKVVAIEPNHAEAYNNRGIALYNLRQYSEALASLDKAIEINPNYIEACKNRKLIINHLK
ncbi:MAG: tetratricopeptide repeat protein [Gammaproteobacteria bacterium]